ncbi:MAG: hypothetical protein A2148_09395, partial [Chloroflexi bacterium RBG_16_68_14]
TVGAALGYPNMAVVLPYAAMVTGDPWGLELAEEAGRMVLSPSAPAPPLVSVLAQLGLALIAVLRKDRGLAAEQYEALQPFRGTLPGTFYQIDHALALLALTMGRVDDAIGHFEEALAFCRRGYRAPYASAAYDYAEALFQRSEAEDRNRAATLVDEALAIARELGMRPLIERAVGLKLRLQGIDPSHIKTSIGAVAVVVQVERPDLRPHAAPDGSVTLMFTDIADSTAMAERLGDERWLAVIRAHNAIVRERVKAHGGVEVSHRGDGFMVAFPGPRAGVLCAVAVQRAFAERNPEHPDEQILVRIGLHTGQPARDEDTFYGTDVNLAARIADDVAEGGQIAVSSRLRELLQGDGDIELGQQRQVALKGLSGKHGVFEVRWREET